MGGARRRAPRPEHGRYSIYRPGLRGGRYFIYRPPQWYEPSDPPLTAGIKEGISNTNDPEARALPFPQAIGHPTAILRPRGCPWLSGEHPTQLPRARMHLWRQLDPSNEIPMRSAGPRTPIRLVFSPGVRTVDSPAGHMLGIMANGEGSLLGGLCLLTWCAAGSSCLV